MLESGNHDAARRSRHALHVTEHERRCDGVRLAGTTASDDHGDVSADQLREALGLVEVNFTARGRSFRNGG